MSWYNVDFRKRSDNRLDCPIDKLMVPLISRMGHGFDRRIFGNRKGRKDRKESPCGDMCVGNYEFFRCVIC